jgi:hypothetical protein
MFRTTAILCCLLCTSAVIPKKQVHLCYFTGCGKIYRNPKELKIHIRSAHTGEKPFVCEFCDDSFVSAIKKEVHIEIVHPEVPPLKCELCPRSFFRNHRMKEHMKR